MAWQPGDAIVRREVWRGEPYGAWGGIVVQDDDDLLALYMPEHSPLAMPDDFFGEPHPWHGKDRWQGHGVLHLQRPDEAHAVWVFWQGDERALGAWYLNLQEPFRRTPIGIDTQDLELDVVVAPDGAWRFKDDERLEPWIERGRYTLDEVAAIRAEGARIATELEAGRRWWSDDWAGWRPDPDWPLPQLPEGWETVAASQP